jgi:hypothetical protein
MRSDELATLRMSRVCTDLYAMAYSVDTLKYVCHEILMYTHTSSTSKYMLQSVHYITLRLSCT